jgi:tetratricopeptide (TPR) repeat protein
MTLPHNPPSPGSGKTGFLKSIVNVFTGDNQPAPAGSKPAVTDRDIQDLTRAISKNPDDDSLYYKRGKAYSARRDFRNAIADFNRVLSINPQDPDALYHRGLVFSDIKEFDRAIDDFTSVIQPRSHALQESRI